MATSLTTAEYARLAKIERIRAEYTAAHDARLHGERLRDAAADLLAIARMAADGTYIPKDHARAVLERHGLEPGKDEG